MGREDCDCRSVYVPLCDVWGGGAQTAQREWCIQYMCHGRTTGFGTSTTYGANINCTCIMNPTNVTGYMTENKTKK